MMITVPIPPETRALTASVTAEISRLRGALTGGWTTLVAVEDAELALKRLHDQIPALRLQVRQLRAKARAVRIEAELMRRAG